MPAWFSVVSAADWGSWALGVVLGNDSKDDDVYDVPFFRPVWGKSVIAGLLWLMGKFRWRLAKLESERRRWISSVLEGMCVINKAWQRPTFTPLLYPLHINDISVPTSY